ncbi:MAG: type II toxin-antitoxin system VapC family toxin [bacterium]
MYLDSAILVKLVVREPDSFFYADLLDGQSSVCSSELALTECRSALLRKCKQGQIDARTLDRAWSRLQALWTDGGLMLHPVTRIVLLEAGEVIKQCIEQVPLRTLDAIHIASCLLLRAYPLVTNDQIMRAAAEMLRLPLLDITPPPEPPTAKK